jgi:hypothetical protein
MQNYADLTPLSGAIQVEYLLFSYSLSFHSKHKGIYEMSFRIFEDKIKSYSVEEFVSIRNATEKVWIATNHVNL